MSRRSRSSTSLLGIAVDNGDVEGFLREVFCKGATHLTGAENQDLHYARTFTSAWIQWPRPLILRSFNSASYELSSSRGHRRHLRRWQGIASQIQWPPPGYGTDALAVDRPSGCSHWPLSMASCCDRKRTDNRVIFFP